MIARALSTPIIDVPPLRPLLRITSNAVRPAVRAFITAGRRGGALFWLVLTGLMFVPIVLIDRQTLVADLGAIAVTVALTLACFAASPGRTSRMAIALATDGLLIAALALDWNAFGAYWAVLVTLLAASVGLALRRRNGEASTAY